MLRGDSFPACNLGVHRPRTDGSSRRMLVVRRHRQPGRSSRLRVMRRALAQPHGGVRQRTFQWQQSPRPLVELTDTMRRDEISASAASS